MNKKNRGKVIVLLVAMGILMFGCVYGGITLSKNWGKSKDVISRERAEDKLNDIYDDIDVNIIEPRKEPIDIGVYDVKDTLPDIDKYPTQVDNTTQTYIEIFSSGEKTGTGNDSWLIDVANDFNSSGIKVNGKTVSVRIRQVSSGLGMDYIISEKYIPDAYNPSNELWGEMIKAKGMNIELYDERMVGNVAGVLISKNKYADLIDTYGSINLKNITDLIAEGEIAMGYTNPFQSATGLNFLVSTLVTFDSNNPLSEKAIEGFEAFQSNIPLVAHTTLQMKSSAESKC